MILIYYANVFFFKNRNTSYNIILVTRFVHENLNKTGRFGGSCLPADVCHRIVNIPKTRSVPTVYNFMLSVSCSDSKTTSAAVEEGRERIRLGEIIDAA